jgi:hypothetical protein
MGHPARRALLLFWRAERLRCPNCGGGPLFRSWFRMRPYCPACGLPLERGDQGYLAFDLLSLPPPGKSFPDSRSNPAPAAYVGRTTKLWFPVFHKGMMRIRPHGHE